MIIGCVVCPRGSEGRRRARRTERAEGPRGASGASGAISLKRRRGKEKGEESGVGEKEMAMKFLFLHFFFHSDGDERYPPSDTSIERSRLP